MLGKTATVGETKAGDDSGVQVGGTGDDPPWPTDRTAGEAVTVGAKGTCVGISDDSDSMTVPWQPTNKIRYKARMIVECLMILWLLCDPAGSGPL